MNILKKCRQVLATLLVLTLTTAFASARELPAPTWAKHSVKNTEIKLTWNKVDDALNYTLFYKDATAKKYCQRVVAGTTTSWFGVKGKTYEFYLIANPKCGKGLEKSAASETKVVLLDEAANPKVPLATPTWDKISVSKTKISLRWNEVDDALNYTLYYKEANAKNFCKRVVACASTTYYGVMDKTYEFYLVANPKYNDGRSESAASEMKAVTLGENNPVNPDPENPVDPENPNPENDELTLSATTDETTITVSWKPVENASEYEVFWKEKGANGDEEKSGKFASSSRDTVSHVINNCEIGKTYAVRVIAYMSEGAEKEASIDVTVRNLTPLPTIYSDGTAWYYRFVNASPYQLSAYVAVRFKDWKKVREVWDGDECKETPTFEFQIRPQTDDGDAEWVSFDDVEYGTFGGEYYGACGLKSWEGNALQAGQFYQMRVRIKATQSLKDLGYTDSEWTEPLSQVVGSHPNGKPTGF